MSWLTRLSEKSGVDRCITCCAKSVSLQARRGPGDHRRSAPACGCFTRGSPPLSQGGLVVARLLCCVLWWSPYQHYSAIHRTAKGAGLGVIPAQTRRTLRRLNCGVKCNTHYAQYGHGCAEGQESGAQGLDWPRYAGRSLSEVLANVPLRMMRPQATDIRDRFAYHLRCSVAENLRVHAEHVKPGSST